MMIKIRHYTKPYLPIIFLAIGLLYAQASLDLALPDYFSKIINVGVQQNGIIDAVPEAIRESQYDRCLLFLSESEQEDISLVYIFVNSTDTIQANYEDYLEKYPILINESIFIRKDIAKEKIEELNPIMGKALFTVMVFELAIENKTMVQEMEIEFPLNISAIESVDDLFILIEMIPESNRITIRDEITQRFSTLETMLLQASIQAVRREYEALGMTIESIQNKYVINTGLIMLGLTLLSVICTIAVGYISAKTAAGMAHDLRRDIFKKIESFSHEEYDKFSTSSLITRTTNDVTQIQMVTMMLIRMVFYAPILGIGGIIKAVNKSSSMWWLIAVAVGLLLSLILIVFWIALPKFKSVQKLVDKLNLVSRENLTGMMVIRAFNMQNFEEERFNKANKNLTSVSLFINRVMTIMMPIMMFIMNILVIAIVWVGAHQVADGQMQIGDMMAFMTYSMQIVMSFLMLTMMFIMLPRAAVSANRISKVLQTTPAIHDITNPSSLPENFKGTVEFRNVSFRYHGAEEDAICNISFKAVPGETTAIIGATGAGKSTILNLIPRFYEVNSGEILLDGVDIKTISQHDLREKLGYVGQKNVLLSGTIESNLRYANEEAPNELLQQAIDISQASTFVEIANDGMQRSISQAGSNVSGGQKQRLAIARAIVKQPPIYLLDDSFSALDFKTESKLRMGFKKHIRQSNLIIVTQRVTSVMNAEKIIVLDEGKIVGKGTHKKLMESCQTYKEIALSQIKEEDLA